MRFALPPWEPSDPNCDHPFFGPVGSQKPEPAITDLEHAYMAPGIRSDRDGGLRKLGKRDICRAPALGCASLEKNRLLLLMPALTHSKSNAFRSC